MKKILLFCLLGLMIFSANAQSEFSLLVYAGSNAPWGESQYLSIDSKGNCSYSLAEVGKGVKDSSSFKITQSQLKQISELLNKIKFFKLNEKYNEKSRDGTRLSVEASVSGKTHKVHWINIHTTESDELLAKLNAILKTKQISLTY